MTGRAGTFVLVAVVLGALLALPLVGRKMPVRSAATVNAGAYTFGLVGIESDACITTVRACLERLPGIERVTVSRASATLVPKSGSIDEKAVIAAVRESGHEVANSEAVSPRLPALGPDELAKLDRLDGPWLEVRCKPSACLECASRFEQQVQQLEGVREVVVVHFRDHLAVHRDPARCSARRLAEHVRSVTHEPVTISPTRLVTVGIQNMTCNKCIGSIRGVLLRTDGVLSPQVELGAARVVVSGPTSPKKVVAAVESAPGPACKSFPEHVFKAQVTDERDD